MTKRVIIVHGWGGYPKEGWRPWLKEKLEKKGFKVLVPAMPDTDNPKIETWVPKLAQVVGEPREDDVLIGHSMGCQTILRYLETLPEDQKVDKVILVAGFGPYLSGLTDEEKPTAKPWMETPLDFKKIRSKARSFVAIFSDNDPHVPLEENSKLFKEELGAKIIVEHGKRHMSGDDGIFELPVLLELI